MQHRFIILIITIFMFSGCRYEVPLVATSDRPIDPEILGLWKLIPEPGEDPEEVETMMILAYSDTEYLIHHPVGQDDMYYRAYPIKVGDKACVQLQIIGDEDGPLRHTGEGLYLVAAYELIQGRLEVTILNTDVLSNTFKTSRALRKAFRSHIEHPALFDNPGTFIKVP